MLVSLLMDLFCRRRSFCVVYEFMFYACTPVLLAVKNALAQEDDAALGKLLHAGMRHPDNVVRYPSA